MLESPTLCAGAKFGDVMEDVAGERYEAGATVRTVFRSACPRNNVRLEGTFLTVERQNKSSPDGWDVVILCNNFHQLPIRCWPASGNVSDHQAPEQELSLCLDLVSLSKHWSVCKDREG